MLDLCLSVVPLCCVEEVPLELRRDGSNSLSRDRSVVRQRTLPILEKLRESIARANDSSHDRSDEVLTTQLQRALVHSGYCLTNVHCEIESSTVHLFGFVKSYHALQMAIQIARKIAAGRRIQLEVDVVPRLYEDDVEDGETPKSVRC